MSYAMRLYDRERNTMMDVRALADQGFSRAAGAPLVAGNIVRLLKDASENYPAWLEAIGAARRNIHFESYIIHEDDAGRMFADALVARARDGVDVRLLVPNGTDIPLLRPLSRAGYRPLLEAGVRVFEWNGTMLHAKMAVADGRWARVGSTNLNLASWLGNCELDAVVEDEPFARQVGEMYLQDLTNATEVVLDVRHRVRAPGEPRHPHPTMTSGGGSAGRAAAGAVRIGNAIGAAFTNRRVLEPVEARLMVTTGAMLSALAILFALFPRLLVYPLVFILAWFAVTLLYRGLKLYRAGAREAAATDGQAAPPRAAEAPREVESNKE
jgi:phosphatidylserine/phosphatidylglycerophosphate/cardiolipin synthase-like enzyme